MTNSVCLVSPVIIVCVMQAVYKVTPSRGPHSCVLREAEEVEPGTARVRLVCALFSPCLNQFVFRREVLK